ncbi:MAG: hypothetical protein MK289_23820, partial [Trichodesmium sp. ALOHA_ZT_67]|nr:hypothetical protein [Trichodesmium sp. ALOHA_ZT_67]
MNIREYSHWQILLSEIQILQVFLATEVWSPIFVSAASRGEKPVESYIYKGICLQGLRNNSS